MENIYIFLANKGGYPPCGAEGGGAETLQYDLMIMRENTKVVHFSCDMAWAIQHMSNEKGVGLKARSLIIGLVSYFPISHSNEHCLPIIGAGPFNNYVTLPPVDYVMLALDQPGSHDFWRFLRQF